MPSVFSLSSLCVRFRLFCIFLRFFLCNFRLSCCLLDLFACIMCFSRVLFCALLELFRFLGCFFGFVHLFVCFLLCFRCFFVHLFRRFQEFFFLGPTRLFCLLDSLFSLFSSFRCCFLRSLRFRNLLFHFAYQFLRFLRCLHSLRSLFRRYLVVDCCFFRFRFRFFGIVFGFLLCCFRRFFWVPHHITEIRVDVHSTLKLFPIALVLDDRRIRRHALDTTRHQQARAQEAHHCRIDK